MSAPPKRAGRRVTAAVETLDVRTGRVPLMRRMLRYVFPEHWSFMWGEIALYCFVVLVVTGVYLAFFFDPSYQEIIYRGRYTALRGQKMSEAYASVVDLSWKWKAGLLMRQTHHWAADVFVAAITIHMLRVFFTGAFRKPRELLYWTGVTLLTVAVLEGYMGYSLIDDLLSGMGLAIGWAVVMSIPIVGGPLATWLWDGQFPGTTAFESRLYIAHVFIVPLLIATLIGIHLLLIMLLHHTQFRGRGRREENVVGSPMWPSYTFRSLGLFGAVTGGLFLLGGLVQINPIWLWGPYHPYIGENGAQPDWYIGWLIGALRMMPGWEPVIDGKTIVPNPFWGGALFPLLVFGILYAWPLLERRVTGDRAVHHLLERPRDNPWRTAIGVGLFTWVSIAFFEGSMDRLYLQAGIPYENAVRVLQVAWIVVPIVAGYVTLRVCRHLQAAEIRPLRGVTARMVERTPGGGFVAGAALMDNPSWAPVAGPPPPSGVKEALGVLGHLARLELRSAARELAVKARASALAALLVGAGVVLGLAALGAVVTMIVVGIAALGLPLWAAGLIVAGVLAAAAGSLARAGRRAGRRP